MPFDFLPPSPVPKRSLEVQLLQNAKLLISKRRHWCKHSLKRTRFYGSEAYCAEGALAKSVSTTGDLYGVKLRAICFLDQAAAEQLPGSRIFSFNDSRQTSHKMILAAFDRAIELASRA